MDKIFICPQSLCNGLYDGGHGAGLDDFLESDATTPLIWVVVFYGYSLMRVPFAPTKTDLLMFGERNAPDGIVGPHREKEGSFYTIKEIWSPIYIPRKVITPSFNGRLEIENRYTFNQPQSM